MYQLLRYIYFYNNTIFKIETCVNYITYTYFIVVGVVFRTITYLKSLQ
jgi:hypothetical protein